VGDEDLSQAIGRGGQNVRLASKMIGKELDIYGQTEFGNMPPEEKEVLFKPREGVKIPGLAEAAAPAVSAVPSKFSELESLFSKKKPEGDSGEI
jgi:transcription antitermination factor NusA-like protein